MKQNVIHLSGLNGLRAIAALSVVFSHTTNDLSSFGLNSFIFGQYPDGNPKTTLLASFGVSIFFSLSGFLITYLLLKEARKSEINIKHFYIRRMLRIWPLYYLYLILCLGTLLLFNFNIDFRSILLYSFLLANIPTIFGGIISLLAHYWSLGVEEQFYSFWPWIIKKSKSILKTTIIMLASLLFLKTALRIYDLFIYNGHMSWPYNFINVTRFQSMLIGAVGAILYFQNNTLFLKILDNKITQFISWFIILLVAINKFHIISLLDNEFISVVTVCLIIGQINKSNRLINLSFPLFDFIGKISYGIYVIHPLVIFYLSKMITVNNTTAILPYLIVYFSIFAATITLSFLSYEFFEKRFLMMKAKYSTVLSANTVA